MSDPEHPPAAAGRPGATTAGQPDVLVPADPSPTEQAMANLSPPDPSPADQSPADQSPPDPSATASPEGGLVGPQALAPAVQTQWRLGLLLRAIVPSALLAAATWFLLRKGDWSWTTGAALAPWAVTAFLAWRLPPRRYASWRYELGPDALRLGRGVMFRSESVVPYTRIQHVDTEQGPFERMLGIARVTVHTASASSRSLTIPGLLPADAERLRERLALLAGMVEPL